MKEVIVRIPPSPTGLLHLGTARTALFNYLFAKHHNGKMVFRWEDTDKTRSKSEFETNILEGLKWLGMDFEKESHLVVRQSDSAERHAEVLAELWEAGKVFPCFCTPEMIDAKREEANKAKQNFVFWSPCRDMSQEEAETKMKSEPFVWRLRVPKDREMTFADHVRKEITVNTNTLGDFTVARSDGSVLYLLANVIDDVDQGITHILRGEDGISNTPKQMLLFEALEKELPEYAHIPLVFDHQKRKLSKRNVEPGTCVLIEDFQKAGFLPEGVLNGLAFLGWNPKSEEEVFSMEDLIGRFDLPGVSPAGAQYDFEKMRWFNNQWLNKLSIEDLQKQFEVFAKTSLDDQGVRALTVAREKARTFEDIQAEFEYLIETPKVDKSMLLHEKFGVDDSLVKKVLGAVKSLIETDGLGETPDDIKQQLIVIIKELELKNGAFLWPLRITLSGQEKSSSPFDILWGIGQEEALNRIETILEVC